MFPLKCYQNTVVFKYNCINELKLEQPAQL